MLFREIVTVYCGDHTKHINCVGEMQASEAHGTCSSSHLIPEDGGSRYLQVVGNDVPECMASHLIRQS
jgi:hypothetical protein